MIRHSGVPSSPDVIVYYCTVSADDLPLYDRLCGKIQASRLEKINRLRFLSDRNLALAAEALLMHACERESIDYQGQHIETNEYGKPRFRDSAFHFNITHSGNLAACAVSGIPIGCDAEQITPLSPCDPLLSALTPAELEAFYAHSPGQERDRYFFRLWTAKESLLKCVGTGLSAAPTDIQLAEQKGVLSYARHPFTGDFSLKKCDLQPGYCACVCLPIPQSSLMGKSIRCDRVLLDAL